MDEGQTDWLVYLREDIADLVGSCEEDGISPAVVGNVATVFLILDAITHIGYNFSSGPEFPQIYSSGSQLSVEWLGLADLPTKYRVICTEKPGCFLLIKRERQPGGLWLTDLISGDRASLSNFLYSSVLAILEAR